METVAGKMKKAMPKGGIQPSDDVMSKLSTMHKANTGKKGPGARVALKRGM